MQLIIRRNFKVTAQVSKKKMKHKNMYRICGLIHRLTADIIN